MKKIIYLFAATLAVTIQGVALAAELTETISNGDLQKIQDQVCNNPQVTQVLANNTLDELYIAPATGGGDDDDGSSTSQYTPPISAQEVFTSLCS